MVSQFRNNKGVTSIEYAILIMMVAIAIIITLEFMGNSVEKTFCYINAAIDSGQTSICGIPKGVSLSYVDPSLGGTGNTGDSSNFASKNTATAEYATSDSTVANNLSLALASLNAKDPIEEVYGLYDGHQKLVSGYQSAVDTLGYTTRTDNDSWDDGRFAYTLGGDGTPYFQVVTASGAVYDAERIGWTTGAELVNVANTAQNYTSKESLPSD